MSKELFQRMTNEEAFAYAKAHGHIVVGIGHMCPKNGTWIHRLFCSKKH